MALGNWFNAGSSCPGVMAVLRMEMAGKEGTQTLPCVYRLVSKIAVKRDFPGLGGGSVSKMPAAQHKDLHSTPRIHVKAGCNGTCLESPH